MPTVAVVGRHGTGKTTFIEQLLVRLGPARPVAVLKRSHHEGLSWDAEGSDTARAFAAGAAIVAGGSPDHLVLHYRRPGTLAEILDRLRVEAPPPPWLVLEGFHREVATLPDCRVVVRVRDAVELDELTREGGFRPWAVVPAFPDGLRGPVPGARSAHEVIERLAGLGPEG